MMLDSARTRFLYKALDAVMTASIRPRRSPGGHLRRILGPGASRYDRIASIVGLLDWLLPGTGRRASELLRRPQRLPFAGAQVEILGAGSGSTVFLVRAAGAGIVVKAYRRTVGRRRAALLELADEFRRKFETVSSWYAGIPGLVVPASFLILHGPLLGRPAVACVQPYIAGEKLDLFRDLGENEQIRLLEGSPGLREQFVPFARRTLDLYRSSGRSPDFLGAENLVVVGGGNSRQLKLIDYGILDLAVLGQSSPAASTALAGRVQRLESLLDSVSSRAEKPSPGDVDSEH